MFVDYFCEFFDMFVLDFDEVFDGDCFKMVVCYLNLFVEEFVVCVVSVGMVDEVYVIILGKLMLEISVKGVVKDFGLFMLCDYLGIDWVDIVVFGDGVNDVEMFVWVGDFYVMVYVVLLVVVVVCYWVLLNVEDGVV